MILQSLNRYYDILMDNPDIDLPAFGYSYQSVSHALNISSQGELLDVIPLFERVQRGKTIREVPRKMICAKPAQACKKHCLLLSVGQDILCLRHIQERRGEPQV